MMFCRHVLNSGTNFKLSHFFCCCIETLSKSAQLLEFLESRDSVEVEQKSTMAGQVMQQKLESWEPNGMSTLIPLCNRKSFQLEPRPYPISIVVFFCKSDYSAFSASWVENNIFAEWHEGIWLHNLCFFLRSIGQFQWRFSFILNILWFFFSHYLRTRISTKRHELNSTSLRARNLRTLFFYWVLEIDFYCALRFTSIHEPKRSNWKSIGDWICEKWFEMKSKAKFTASFCFSSEFGLRIVRDGYLIRPNK